MKIISNKIFLSLILICVSVCCYQYSKNKSNSISGRETESFVSFISRFREDSVFQKSRLYISDSYAIVDKNGLDSTKCNDKNLLWSEYDETCYDIILIDRDNWKFVKSELLQERNEENWFAVFDTINEMKIKYVAGWNNASEAWYEILFEKINNKWYLVQFIDYDNIQQR